MASRSTRSGATGGPCRLHAAAAGGGRRGAGCRRPWASRTCCVASVRVCPYQHARWQTHLRRQQQRQGLDCERQRVPQVDARRPQNEARLQAPRPQVWRLRWGHRAALSDAQEDGAAGAVPEGARRRRLHAAAGAVHPRPPQDAVVGVADA
ncbi:unnamed protein product [Phaeothamnion confervicola]